MHMILVAGLSSVQNTAQNGTIIDELNISRSWGVFCKVLDLRFRVAPGSLFPKLALLPKETR